MAGIKLESINPISLAGIQNAPNRILRVGIELEGGWKKKPLGLTVDSSVKFPGMIGEDRDHARSVWVANEGHRRWPFQGIGIAQQTDLINEWETAYPPVKGGPSVSGELPSGHGGLALEAWEKWVRANYPSHVNETCGLHVHMSFDSPLVYQRLMVASYPRTVVEEYRIWAKEEKGLKDDHPIWPRLRGESVFCQHIFYADEQVKRHDKDHTHHAVGCRYTVIGYPYKRLGTIECRLLPMFEEVSDSIEAIQRLLDLTNQFLVKTRKKETRVSARVPGTAQEINQRIEVRV